MAQMSSSPRRALPIVLGAAVALVGFALPCRAQTVQDMVGVWKRAPSKLLTTPRYFSLRKGEDGHLVGTILNPPVQGMGMHLDLTLKGSKLVGKATWTEKTYQADTAWEFTLQGDELVGRSEWIDWEGGKVYDRGWEAHRLVRVPRVGLVTRGEGQAPTAAPVADLHTLEGGWLGIGGPWVLKVEAGGVTLTPVGHDEGVSIQLEDTNGLFRGNATLADGGSCKVELAYDADQASLVGRSSWVAAPELGEQAVRGWAPLRFARLIRQDGNFEGTAEAPQPGAASTLAPGVYKRAGGFYLRVHDDQGELTGLLSGPAGTPQARIRFQQKDGLWVGTVNWEGSLETTWELSVTDQGLQGRCQWADLYQGKVVARGWSPCTFTKLRRIQ